MISQSEIQALKFKTLNHFWGFNEFREFQEQIVDCALHGKDAVALLPTGGGKSLCYQLPALLLEGTCIVVSPLLSLMKDQVTNLKNKGVEAEYLSSELDDAESETIFDRCKEGITKLLYVSPERLTNQLFLKNIEEISVSFLAVDEAHCISEWGQDFRPSYQNIKKFRNFVSHAPCIALTATATPKVLQEISEKLELKQPSVFKKSFRRKNIGIHIEQLSNKYQRILEFLQYNKNSGIIFVRTRKESEELANYLNKNGIQNVDYFHAALPLHEKNKKQKKWILSDSRVLISTNAFGMGIDKENVRFIIHFSPPASIENYYQEIGRAGRDGAPSYAMMFWNDQELANFDDILANSMPSKKDFLNIISYVYSIFQVADTEQPESTFQLYIQRIKNFTKTSAAKIFNVLHFLHNQELIYFNNLKSNSSIELKIQPQDLETLPNKDSYFLEMLFRNLAGITSHRIQFSEQNLSNKINIDIALIRERLKELQSKNHIEYIDGTEASIKFLQPRNDRAIQSKYWSLFEKIQKNKLQKWEEMKFYTRNTDYCKTNMILSYFGEKIEKNCGNCNSCESKNSSFFGDHTAKDIIKVLSIKPSTLEEITFHLGFHTRDKIRESLITLLDSGKIGMLDFRTYTLK